MLKILKMLPLFFIASVLLNSKSFASPTSLKQSLQLEEYEIRGSLSNDINITSFKPESNSDPSSAFSENRENCESDLFSNSIRIIGRDSSFKREYLHLESHSKIFLMLRLTVIDDWEGGPNDFVAIMIDSNIYNFTKVSSYIHWKSCFENEIHDIGEIKLYFIFPHADSHLNLEIITGKLESKSLAISEINLELTNIDDNNNTYVFSEGLLNLGSSVKYHCHENEELNFEGNCVENFSSLNNDAQKILPRKLANFQTCQWNGPVFWVHVGFLSWFIASFLLVTLNWKIKFYCIIHKFSSYQKPTKCRRAWYLWLVNSL